MKLTALLLLVFALHLSAKTSSQTITLSGNNIKLEEVFKTIKLQTGYTSFYNDKILSYAKPVSIHAYSMPLEKFLEEIFRQQRGLNYTVKQTSIVVSRDLSEETTPKPDYERIIVFETTGRDVQGYVFEEKTSAPLRGISISVNGTNKVTQSDEKGRFILKGVEDNFTITVTSIGYEKRVIKVTKETTQILVPLQVAVNDLDETIVQAYGTTSKRLATGNITKVSGEEIRKNPVMNPLLALQGRVPGLTIAPTTGHASSPVKVEIRGRNTINPYVVSEPLFVIDGIPQTVLELPGFATSPGVSTGISQAGISMTKGQSPFFGLNPADIQSIEVLKDGDATAIYGSRAANGVILITTRKGKPGKTSFDFDMSQGVLVVPFVPDMLNTQEYLQMRREAFKNDGITPNNTNAPDLLVWDTTRYTNWAKELMGSGKNTVVNAGISGGDLRTNFRINAGYNSQVDLNNRSGGNKVGTVRLSLNHTSANQKFNVALSAGYSSTKVDAISINNEAFMTPPNAPAIYDEEGNLNFEEWRGGSGNSFPFGFLHITNVIKSASFNNNLSIRYVLMKGLTLSSSMSFSTSNLSNEFFNPIAASDPVDNPTGTANFGNTKNSTLAIEPQLGYDRTIAQGRLSVQLGGTVQKTSTRGNTLYALGYTNDDLLKSAGNASYYSNRDELSDYKYAGIFGRINYNWANKYIINFNARRDGSSRFAPGRQFGNFGSAGVAWNASEEEWLQPILPSWLSFVKLRGSYAITGSDAVGDYAYLARFSGAGPGSSRNLFQYDGIAPFVPVVPVNQQYRWEAMKSIDVSMNLGFLNDRINFDLTWYRKMSSNQLTRLPTPLYSGFSQVTANHPATVQNQGVELAINAQIIRRKDLRFNLSFNISRNWNLLYAYPDIDKSPYANLYRVGQSMGMQYRLHFLGINPLNGEYIYEDYNKNGRIDVNPAVLPGTKDDDRYIMIDMNPEFQGSFSPMFEWKDFSLSMAFSFNRGKSDHPTLNISAGGMKNVVLPDDFLNNYWRKPGDNAKYGKLTTRGFSNLESDREIIDASYLRLQNLSFAYRLPEKLIKKAGISDCRFSLQAQNIFTLSSYKIDPDIKGTYFSPMPRVIQGTFSFTL